MSVRSVRAPDRRRQELLDALVEIILHEGFERLSVEEMARRLGCSKSTVYVVAIGKRTSGSNKIVRVPIQRQRPFGVGVSFTGVVVAASSCDVTATIGELNVTESSGAIGTLPSGM